MHTKFNTLNEKFVVGISQHLLNHLKKQAFFSNGLLLNGRGIRF